MTMRPPLEPKAPSEIKDYGINWERYFEPAVSILTSDWTVPNGIVEDMRAVEGQSTVIRVSSGTAGESYALVNTITTSDGETLTRAIEVRVRTPEDIAGI